MTSDFGKRVKLWHKVATMAAAVVAVLGALVAVLDDRMQGHVAAAELRAIAREVASAVRAETRDRHLLVMVNLGRCAVEQLGPLDCDPLEGIWEDEND